jgi:hypothetical protein
MMTSEARVELHHYYHLWSGGKWHEPLSEHLNQLARSGLGLKLAGFYVGIVGRQKNAAEVKQRLEAGINPKYFNVRPQVVAEAEEGYEQVTLDKLRDFVLAQKTNEKTILILYAHAKGSFSYSTVNVGWRRSMTRHLVGGWSRCVDLLTSGKFNAAGCHLLTPHEHPRLVTGPYFGGNFWWARADYLATLPEVSRYHAEGWIGMGAGFSPMNLLPGWPKY